MPRFTLFALLAFSATLVLASTQAQPRRKYLVPSMVLQGDNGDIYCSETTVTCYDNGLYKVCPNPKDPSVADTIEEQYGRGYYIDKRDHCLTQEQFDDPDLWRS